jgi:hypothetical protein
VTALMTPAQRRRDRVSVATAWSPAPALTDRLILALLLAFPLAAQLFDLTTFAVMIGRHGISAEMNPLVAAGFAAFGMPLVALMKFDLIVLLSAIVVILGRDQFRRRSGWKLAALVSAFAVVGGMVGGISNVITI